MRSGFDSHPSYQKENMAITCLNCLNLKTSMVDVLKKRCKRKTVKKFKVICKKSSSKFKIDIFDSMDDIYKIGSINFFIAATDCRQYIEDD